MNQILHSLLDVFYVVYMDNILIYSKDSVQHLDHVQVLEQLKTNLLLAKFEKCSFSTSWIDFLGYIILDTGIEMDPKCISSINTWPTPSNVKTLQC